MSEYEDYEIYEVINTEDLNKVEAKAEVTPSAQPTLKLAPSSQPGVKATPLVKTELEPIKININSIPEHDAWADYAIFFPLANKLKDSIIELEISPMLITVFGSLLRVLVMYYIYNNEPYYAAAAYLIAYIFDCSLYKVDAMFIGLTICSLMLNVFSTDLRVCSIDVILCSNVCFFNRYANIFNIFDMMFDQIVFLYFHSLLYTWCIIFIDSIIFLIDWIVLGLIDLIRCSTYLKAF